MEHHLTQTLLALAMLAGMILASAVATLGAIVVHELGHAAAARLYGMTVVELSFRPQNAFCAYIRQGDAVHHSRERQVLEELVITAAGPGTNLVAGLLLLSLLFAGLPGYGIVLVASQGAGQLLTGVFGFVPIGDAACDADSIRRLWPQWRAMRQQALA